MIWTKDYDGEFSLAQRIGGWLLALVLTIAFVIALVLVDQRNEARLAQAMAQTQGAVAGWRIEAPWGWLTVPVGLSPFLFVPGLFGVRNWRLHPSLGRRVRAPVLILLVIVMGATVWLVSVQSGRVQGVASVDGVAWRRDGRIEQTMAWPQATGVRLRCWTRRHSSRQELIYEVSFPNGRRAKLSPDYFESGLAWMHRIEPVPDLLAAAHVPLHTVDMPECVQAYAGRLDEEDRAQFLRTIGATRD
ncbi:hypothetical protein BH10PSE3_BH10PSE3_31570 [soil metagenome]